jgi:hypothetical protein
MLLLLLWSPGSVERMEKHEMQTDFSLEKYC